LIGEHSTQYWTRTRIAGAGRLVSTEPIALSDGTTRRVLRPIARDRTKVNVTSVQRVSALKALCVGRHRYLSDHFGRFFRKLGVDAVSVVGVMDALDAARDHRPDIVFCEYDLLATVPLEPWERDPFLSRLPVIAVSLTRRSDEMHLLDINNIAGFFYLPALTEDDARKLLHVVRPSAGYSLQSSLQSSVERPSPTSSPRA
jgi:hypothetical protein